MQHRLIVELEPPAGNGRGGTGEPSRSDDPGPFPGSIPGTVSGTVSDLPPRRESGRELRWLALALAERLVPILARIAMGHDPGDWSTARRSSSPRQSSSSAAVGGHVGIRPAAAPTALTGFAAEAALALIRLCAQEASAGPGIGDHASSPAAGSGDLRREALRVAGALAIVGTLPLLGLAESWFIANEEGGDVSSASGCGGLSTPTVERLYGLPLPDETLSPGSAMARCGSGQASVAGRAVRDLGDVVGAAVARGSRLEELDEARRRVRERDGLEGAFPWRPTWRFVARAVPG